MKHLILASIFCTLITLNLLGQDSEYAQVIELCLQSINDDARENNSDQKKIARDSTSTIITKLSEGQFEYENKLNREFWTIRFPNLLSDTTSVVFEYPDARVRMFELILEDGNWQIISDLKALILLNPGNENFDHLIEQNEERNKAKK